MDLLHFTWIYITPPWLYLNLLDSRLLYHGSTSLYMTLHYSYFYPSTSLYFNLLHSTIALLHSTWIYITLPWLYFTLLYITLTMALLHSTWVYCILPQLYFTLLVYITLPSKALLTLLESTAFYHGSILHSNLNYITPQWRYFTLLYHVFTSLNLTLLHSTTALYFTLLDSTLL